MERPLSAEVRRSLRLSVVSGPVVGADVGPGVLALHVLA
jgi:hypothetical protein